ncbi:uncharacterized protein [Nicotiana tomentosiformis]|uniref:uncharacterized protein n=1 Tax=Nicotiana tomentosiformis TaxID=4098 RepID=UPI00388CBCCB
MCPPKGTFNLIEKHFARFFRGLDSEKSKYHWSSWNNLCKSKYEGGTGMRRLVDVSNTSAIKRWWNLRTNHNLWSSFIISKYCIYKHPVAKTWRNRQSHAWKHLLEVKDQAEENILWNINNGDTNFWWDNWTGKGALAKIHPSPARSHRKRVSDYITQGTWNMTKLSEVLPVTMVNHILTVPIGKHEHEDYHIWAKSEDGKFSTKSVYHKEINHSSHDILFQKVWHNKIPFKISFLAWRVLHRKLSIDELMYKFGNYVVSRCHCCNAPKYETPQHIFIDSNLVVKLWNYFGGPLGILHRKRPIRAVLQGWFGTTPVNMVHKMILNITPLAICWEVWKGITSYKYGDKKKIVYSRVYHNTFWILRTALKLAFPTCDWDQPWHKICELVKRLRPNPKILIVLWELPPEGKDKLNPDGSFLHSSGLAGMRGIVRDCRGNMIMAFAVPKRCSNNNMAEAHAAKYGLEWCTIWLKLMQPNMVWNGVFNRDFVISF